jgi:hypothetical protein
MNPTQPQNLNPLRETMMGTLIAWAFLNQIDFEPINGCAWFEIKFSDGESVVLDASQPQAWSFELGRGIPYSEDNGGWIYTPASLLSLLERLKGGGA